VNDIGVPQWAKPYAVVVSDKIEALAKLVSLEAAGNRFEGRSEDMKPVATRTGIELGSLIFLTDKAIR
jgi:hypothetical protein